MTGFFGKEVKLKKEPNKIPSNLTSADKVWCSLLPLCYKQRERNLSLLPLPEMAETPHRLRNNVSDKARILFTPLFTRGNVLIPMFLCSESPILIPMFS